MKPELEHSQEPISIRGHHLRHISIFLGLYMVNIPFINNPILKHAQTQTRDIREQLVMGDSYTEDVLGTTKEEENDYLNKLSSLLTRIQNYPNEYPVIITNGKPDSMCLICHFGDHCSQSGPLLDLRETTEILGSGWQNFKTLGKLRSELINYYIKQHKLGSFSVNLHKKLCSILYGWELT